MQVALHWLPITGFGELQVRVGVELRERRSDILLSLRHCIRQLCRFASPRRAIRAWNTKARGLR
jgi:hypothetical protein